MDLETRKDGKVIYLKILDKNLDSTISTNFKGRVIDLINQGNQDFILNLSQVDFIDSSGLGSIISILKTLTLNNGSLCICEAKSPILNLLAITRLDRVLQTYPSETDALTSFLNSKVSNV